MYFLSWIWFKKLRIWMIGKNKNYWRFQLFYSSKACHSNSCIYTSWNFLHRSPLSIVGIYIKLTICFKSSINRIGGLPLDLLKFQDFHTNIAFSHLFGLLLATYPAYYIHFSFAAFIATTVTLVACLLHILFSLLFF